jgi:hypothetical protein
MNRFFCVVAVLVSLSVTGCGKLADALSNQNNGNTTQPKPADASMVQFKTAQGYVSYPKNSVTSFYGLVQVQSNPIVTKDDTLYDKTSIHAHLSPLKLHVPSEGNTPANWQQNVTGKVTIQYNLGAESRTLYIVNWTTLVDAQYPGTTYTSNTTLDAGWLLGRLDDTQEDVVISQ